MLGMRVEHFDVVLGHRCCQRFVVSLITILVLGGAGCDNVFAGGPYRPPEPLPKKARLLDMHCHTAGIGAGDSGCFISKKLERSWKFGIYLKSFGVSRKDLATKSDAFLLDSISEQISKSAHVASAIILALDGVVNAEGQLDPARTEIYVPNEFVFRETMRHSNLLFGASINPYRRDALTRLEWAKRNNAKLVKWIPSIMQIDPADKRLVPFYRKLVELRIPLLTHGGAEHSFTYANDALCDPARLRLPLSLGVTVIVAHIASTGKNAGERDTDRLCRLMVEFPNLYADISSLTQINKLGYLSEALQRPEFKGRLLYGTDFPLNNTILVSPYYFVGHLTGKQMHSIAALHNPWDRDVALKQALGVPRDVFERPGQFFR